MIIIDQHAEDKLQAALEKLHEAPDGVRCIYFNLQSNAPLPVSLKEKIIAAAGTHASSADTHIYLCNDGDIFILATKLPGKDGKALMLAVAGLVGQPVTEAWAQLLELPLHLNVPLATLEQKMDARRAKETAERKQKEHEQLARKRSAILTAPANAIDFNEKRASRAQAEVMIIEDDMFSRRLVENVLNKQFKFTGLGEAGSALATYARVAPDILFLDINLPDVTGHELLEKVIALDPHAYVVMLSSYSDRDNIVKALSIGAKGFVAKPFTKEKLFQYIERCPTIKRK